MMNCEPRIQGLVRWAANAVRYNDTTLNAMTRPRIHIRIVHSVPPYIRKSRPVMLRSCAGVCQIVISDPYPKLRFYVSLPKTNVTVSAEFYAAAGGAIGSEGICSICRIRKLFSSMNCSSSVRSSRKVGRKRRSFSRLLIKIFCTAMDL